ncbi:CAP domain-containing protein [Flavobacteriaceae bacterium AU392]|nr:CAP domain-containing protein [Flavobacteriaceae bacterium]RKM81459.1 CAP domain-containing protein [Flavobacteriaceae bacterium AU392]
MNKKITYLIIPLLLFMASCSDDETFNLDDDDTISISSQSITEEILELVNEHRQTIGMSSLSRNTVADSLAIVHTNYMISERKISHDNFDERFEQMQLKLNARSAGENVAFGYPTAETVMTGWLNSTGHRANIEGDFTHIGIAAIKNSQGTYYYTQLFYR